MKFGRRSYGLKVDEFRKFARMPEAVDVPVEVALAIHPEETKRLRRLRRSEWNLVNPARVARIIAESYVDSDRVLARLMKELQEA